MTSHRTGPASRLDDLHAMWRIRALEEKVRDLRLEGTVVGSVHLAIGQESVAVGACSQLRRHDALAARRDQYRMA